MELNLFFEPSCLWSERGVLHNNLLFEEHIVKGIPDDDLSGFNIVLFGATDGRNSDNTGCGDGPEKIRRELYRLAWNFGKLKIVDLGNLIIGKTIRDSYSALKDVAGYFLSKNLTIVLIGADQDLSCGLYNAFSQSKLVNIVTVDSSFDLTKEGEDFNASCWLNGVIKTPNLRNVSFVGYQTYFVGEELLDYSEEHNYDNLRLGQIRENIGTSEPCFRDADLVSFDVSGIRFSDFPAHPHASPNGLKGEEACQLARYAGISDRLSMFGLFGYNPSWDVRDQSAMLSAQLIWYFIEGYYYRKQDYPKGNLDGYINFYVEVKDIDFPLIFYKSPRSGRWWMELPDLGEDENEKILVSCTEEDYKIACKNDIPELWWKNYMRGR